MQIQISWLLQKPTHLDLHCLQMQGISGFSRTRVKSTFRTIFRVNTQRQPTNHCCSALISRLTRRFLLQGGSPYKAVPLTKRFLCCSTLVMRTCSFVSTVFFLICFSAGTSRRLFFVLLFLSCHIYTFVFCGHSFLSADS